MLVGIRGTLRGEPLGPELANASPPIVLEAWIDSGAQQMISSAGGQGM